jgi:hypothetical protein
MKIAIGTPMYGGLCADVYRQAVARLGRVLQAGGHQIGNLELGNESLIPRARNIIAWHLLNSTDASHLLWVDADIGFRAEDVMRMLEAKKPIIVAPIPLKTINWQRVWEAARAGVEPKFLHLHSGVFNISYLPGDITVDMRAPFRIKRGGTGLMLVERDVYERLARTTECYINHSPGNSLPQGAVVHNFHPVQVDDEVEDGDLLPEDYGFCDLWRKAGGEIWAAPWCEARHAGTYAFSGVFGETLRPLEKKPR